MSEQIRNDRDVYQGGASSVFSEKNLSISRYKWPNIALEVLQLSFFLALTGLIQALLSPH